MYRGKADEINIDRPHQTPSVAASQSHRHRELMAIDLKKNVNIYETD